MGIDTLNKMLNLSDITLSTAGRAIAQIECYSDAETTFSMILMDAQGKAELELNANIEPSATTKVEFSTSRLEPGSYNAWIEFGGKQFLRKLVIVGEKDDDGFFQSIKKWFN